MTPIVLRRRVTSRSRWLFGLAAVVFAALFAAVFFVHDIADPVLRAIVACLGPCSALALLCLWQALFRADILWTINDETVAMRRRTAFGQTNRAWPMSEVVRVRMRVIEREDAADTYHVELKLASGKRLKLPAYKRRGRSDEIAEQIEAWRAPT